ncbi:MAG: hypothetical protein K6T74_10305 [Geminicoccaceae bacterium]|nr:hypothetical protein [Geminicoccaceae bacterium]
MSVRPALPQPTAAHSAVLVLLLALGTAALADGGRERGAGEPPAVAQPDPAERTRLAAESGAGEDAGVGAGQLGPVERLRIRLLGGNPIFALDWLARGGEPEPGRPPPRLPLP